MFPFVFKVAENHLLDLKALEEKKIRKGTSISLLIATYNLNVFLLVLERYQIWTFDDFCFGLQSTNVIIICCLYMIVNTITDKCRCGFFLYSFIFQLHLNKRCVFKKAMTFHIL